MNIEKRRTETYILTNLGTLDPVTVYVTNYQQGKGKIVIECFGDVWANYWGGMGDKTLQQFFVLCENDYLLNKLLKETTQTDFEAINEMAHKQGSLLCVTNDVEIAMASDAMSEIFGSDWYMDLPICNTSEYEYLGRIVNAVKGAFSDELKQAA
ncbi:MAG: hypothetical protein AB2793_06235 [Candidatus Thiodiazotropha sp.]